MEKTLRRVLQIAGLVIAIIGILIIWRGVTKVIPYMGVMYGGVFTVGGIAFTILGIVMLIGPAISAHKKAKRARKEEKFRAKMAKEMSKH